ncbi:MAG: hypothetical protein IJA26_02670 [Clostridia bacterium]|nr:hypothetical protein [Clostridia bacterium]
MSANAYEILALAMRYVFAGLMALIVLRAWRLTAVDSGRAKKLRRLSPDTGIIGEMLVIDGGEKARPGMRYPVTLEGTLGSGARSDIRVRHSSVRRRHGYYMMTEKGLYVRGHANARLGMDGRWLRELTLHDGEEMRIGRVTLMLVLTGADAAPEEISRRVRHRRPAEEMEAEMDDSIFDAPPVDEADPDDFFFSNPASCLNPYDEYDEVD